MCRSATNGTLEHGEDGLHKIIGELDESFDDSQNAGVRVLSGETDSSSARFDALADKPQEPWRSTDRSSD